MRPNPRARLARLVIVLVVVALIRELSIRRHHADLFDWPRSP